MKPQMYMRVSSNKYRLHEITRLKYSFISYVTARRRYNFNVFAVLGSFELELGAVHCPLEAYRLLGAMSFGFKAFKTTAL